VISFLQISSLQSFDKSILPFNKVILWGHKLHSHTHSYIHWGYQRAFKHLGYPTYWFDDSDAKKLKEFDFSGALFITEGQVDKKIPLREDAFYILHNCTSRKYDHLKRKKQAIIMQVYTHDCIGRPLKKMDDFILYNVAQQIIYMPWATDLLPHEIEAMKSKVRLRSKTKEIYFIGTIGSSYFGNMPQISKFKHAARQKGFIFKNTKNVSMEENITLVQKSYMAPALQGAWQVRKGYIPCRIFKNISYGQMGITNSKTVNDLFGGKLVYHPNTDVLFKMAHEKLQNMDIQELYDLMDLVKDKHTYLNRIESLLSFFCMVRSA